MSEPQRSPLISGLGPDERRTVQELRRAGRYFWLDLFVQPGADSVQAHRRLLQAELGVSDDALDVLFDYGDTPLVHKFHADGEHVVFAFHHIVHPDAAIEEGADAIDAVEVHVLVHGDYMVTVHELSDTLQPPPVEAPLARRDEKYVVFFALYRMTTSLFEALSNIVEQVEELEDLFIEGRFDPATDRTKIPVLRARLTTIRRFAGRQQGLFAHVAEEIEHVEGLEGSGAYFERIDAQLARLVSGIDAAAHALAALIDQGMNGIMFRLTAVATVFLPLTVLTGFFGMNFGWLVSHIDTLGSFILLGFGSMALAILLSALAMRRQLPYLLGRRLRRTARGTTAAASSPR